MEDGALVLDCQADILRDLGTRFVVPLIPAGMIVRIDRLNPNFTVNGEALTLYPQGAATVPRAELRPHVASLAKERYVILNAIDILLKGN